MAAAPTPTLGTDSSSVEAVARGLVEAEERAAKAPAKASAPQPPVTEPEAEPEPVEEPAEGEEPAPHEPAQEPAEGEETEPEAAEGEPTYTVQLDGKPTEVPLSELMSGYLRQRDYTQKTQAVATERTKIEAERTKFSQEQEQLAAWIGPKIQALEQALTAEDPKALEELRVTDPGAWSARMVQRQLQIDLAQKLRADQQALQQQALSQRIPQERSALATAVPEFAKDFAGTYRKTGEYVLSQGFTPAEWDEVYDHRVVRMAFKAMRYDEIATRKAPEVKKQLSQLPKVARPGSPKAPGQVKAERAQAQREAAFKSGRPEDIAAYLERAHPIS